MMDYRRTRARFAAGAVCLAVGVVGTLAAELKQQRDDRWVAHSYEVGECIEHMTISLERQRAAAPSKELLADFERLRTLTRDNEGQQRRLDRIGELLQTSPMERARVWELLDGARAEEERLESARRNRASLSQAITHVATAVSFGAAILLLVIFWRRLAQQLATVAAAMRLIKESEALTAALIEHTGDIIWSVDRDLRLTACNQRFGRLPPKASEGEPSLADIAAWREQYDAAFRGQKVTLDVGQFVAPGRERCFMVSFTPILVDGSVSGVAAFARDITTRKRTELKLAQRAETLHYLAVYDQLTQLHNRRGFLELGGALVREARGNSQSISVLFVDLDGLKTINDSLGHGAGDNAICSAADCLTESVRRTDVVGRLGGDEFVVVAAGVDDDNVLIERIHKNAAARSLSMSIGVVREEPGDEQKTLEELVERADGLMYKAKVARKSRHLAAI